MSKSQVILSILVFMLFVSFGSHLFSLEPDHKKPSRTQLKAEPQGKYKSFKLPERFQSMLVRLNSFVDPTVGGGPLIVRKYDEQTFLRNDLQNEVTTAFFQYLSEGLFVPLDMGNGRYPHKDETLKLFRTVLFYEGLKHIVESDAFFRDLNCIPSYSNAVDSDMYLVLGHDLHGLLQRYLDHTRFVLEENGFIGFSYVNVKSRIAHDIWDRFHENDEVLRALSVIFNIGLKIKHFSRIFEGLDRDNYVIAFYFSLVSKLILFCEFINHSADFHVHLLSKLINPYNRFLLGGKDFDTSLFDTTIPDFSDLLIKEKSHKEHKVNKGHKRHKAYKMNNVNNKLKDLPIIPMIHGAFIKFLNIGGTAHAS